MLQTKPCHAKKGHWQANVLACQAPGNMLMNNDITVLLDLQLSWMALYKFSGLSLFSVRLSPSVVYHKREGNINPVAANLSEQDSRRNRHFSTVWMDTTLTFMWQMCRIFKVLWAVEQATKMLHGYMHTCQVSQSQHCIHFLLWPTDRSLFFPTSKHLSASVSRSDHTLHPHVWQNPARGLSPQASKANLSSTGATMPNRDCCILCWNQKGWRSPRVRGHSSLCLQ